ncbi:MAG: hypothetical protein H0V00_00595 [Chloroflexia bacterium]|nr:hypothetical protein [Chloroflexia bacterium]
MIDGEAPDAEAGGTSMQLDRPTAERLALVRYLYSVADQQARLPESVRSIAVLTLHDAVELFLHLAAQYVNVSLTRGARLEFNEYFGKIAEAEPSKRLTRQQHMGQLNAARVGLKHQGIRPSSAEVESFRLTVREFLIENTPKVFGVSLESVSIVDLVRFPACRAHLRDAELGLASGKTGDAMIAVVQAFQSMIDEYEQEAKQAHGRSPFSFAGDFSFDKSFFRRGPIGDPFSPRNQGDFEDKIIDSINSLAGAVRMLSLGLDYRRYARFRLLTPPAHLLPIRGKPGPQLHLDETDNWPPSLEDCQFCFGFAIDSALQLQEVVFEKPSWRLGGLQD